MDGHAGLTPPRIAACFPYGFDKPLPTGDNRKMNSAPPRKKRFRFLGWFGAGAVLLALILLSSWRFSDLEAKRNPKAEVKSLQTVRVAEVKQEPIERLVYCQGTARTVNREYLYFRKPGVVTSIMTVIDKGFPQGRDLREGDRVNKGDVLAQVDPEHFEADFEVAKAALAAARARHKVSKAELARSKILIQDQIRSQAEHERTIAEEESSRADVQVAHARLKQAELAIEETLIVAPREGMVAYMNIRKGDYFSPNTVRLDNESGFLKTIPIVLIDTSEFEIIVEIPSYEASGVMVGNKAYLVINDALAEIEQEGPSADKPVPLIIGSIYSVNPVIEPGARSIQAKIRTAGESAPDGQGLRLKDGGFMICHIVAESAPAATILPYEALLFVENRPYCYTAEEISEEDGRTTAIARRRDVKLGIEGPTSCQILSGLEGGDRIIIEGQHVLVDGARIVIEE